MSWYCWGTPSECTAIRKFVRRSPGVNTNMTSQFPWVRKRLRALRTVVWLLSSVGTNNDCKVAWTGEWLRTARTCVKFLACVNTNMIDQSTLIRKLFMTSRTLIWLLTTVSANMPCQVTWLREWFRTVRTRIMVSHQYEYVHDIWAGEIAQTTSDIVDKRMAFHHGEFEYGESNLLDEQRFSSQYNIGGTVVLWLVSILLEGMSYPYVQAKTSSELNYTAYQ